MIAFLRRYADLQSVVVSVGAIILGAGIDVLSTCYLERYILEHLQNGESHEMVVQHLVADTHTDVVTAELELDEFMSRLLSRHVHEGTDLADSVGRSDRCLLR